VYIYLFYFALHFKVRPTWLRDYVSLIQLLAYLTDLSLLAHIAFSWTAIMLKNLSRKTGDVVCRDLKIQYTPHMYCIKKNNSEKYIELLFFDAHLKNMIHKNCN